MQHSIIIYYSYSGNTRRVAQVLAQYLKEKGGTELIELQPLDESNKFFVQAKRAFCKTRAKLGPVNFDLSEYSLICLGTPVWAFGPAPAMNTYLDNCSGVARKEIILFTTFGSGAGAQRCPKYMQDILSKKGATNFKKLGIQEAKTKDKEFVLSAIKETLNK